jgi:F-type H+-transporting ATPase subunit b
MPQLNPEWYLSQIVWLAITFVVLYVILVRTALPRIVEVMQERQEKINDDMHRAETLKTEAEGVLAAYEKLMAETRTKAEAKIREAAERAAKDAEAQNAALGERLAREAAAAEARIVAARRQALADLRQVATEAAQAAAGKLAGLAVGADEARSAVAAVAPRFEERG